MIEPGKKMRKKLEEGQFEEKIVEIEVLMNLQLGCKYLDLLVWKI